MVETEAFTEQAEAVEAELLGLHRGQAVLERKEL
jgi:hypothetical protein